MDFAPYGHMPDEWNAAADLARPDRFINADGSPANNSQWVAWLESMADELASFLWPRYVKGEWLGAAKAGALTLTRADLKLMGPLFNMLALPATTTSTVTHERLFLAEDPQPPNVAGFLHYAPGAPTKFLAHFTRLLLEGGGSVARPASINLKRRMQRPRPYQTSLMVEPSAIFKHRAASSATSPAMISGHCFQGVMALVNVVVEYEALVGQPLDATLLGNVQQYFIDSGDRRVFAGVHYPTDNLSSWFVALRYCCRVFASEKRDRARAVLWDAISQKSAVFLALVAAAREDEASPFAGPLKCLVDEARAACTSGCGKTPSAEKAEGTRTKGKRQARCKGEPVDATSSPGAFAARRARPPTVR